MITKVYIIGAGDHARLIAHHVKDVDQKPILIGTKSDRPTDIAYLDEEQFFANLPSGNDWGLICGVGSTGDMSLRARVLQKYEKLNDKFVNVISRKAMVDGQLPLSGGIFIGSGAIVSPNVTIGRHSIINTGSIVEHDCAIGENCHLAPGSIVLGGVKMDRDVFIGAGALIREGVTLAKRLVIGAYSFSNRSVNSQDETWLGIPAKLISKKETSSS